MKAASGPEVEEALVDWMAAEATEAEALQVRPPGLARPAASAAPSAYRTLQY